MASRSAVSDTESDSTESDSSSCFSESTCSSSESESSPQRSVVQKEKNCQERVSKAGRYSTESHRHRAKQDKKHNKHKPKLKLSHYRYKAKGKKSRKHKYYKKRKNEHKQAKSNTAITSGTNSPNRVAAALLTVPNQTMKHPVLFNSWEPWEKFHEKIQEVTKKKATSFSLTNVWQGANVSLNKESWAVFIHYILLQNKRWSWCGVLPPLPINNFRKTKLIPTNYISLETEFNGE